MLWFWVMRLMSIFGIVFVLKQMSLMERLQRKKYIGVCRCVSEMTAKMMSKFPSTVTRYMQRNRLKTSSWSWGSSVSPRRRNSETAEIEWFLDFIFLIILMKMRTESKKTKTLLDLQYLYHLLISWKW